MCYTCQALKLPCEHDFRKCPEVEKARKPKGPEGNSKNTPAGGGKNSRPDEPSGVHSGWRGRGERAVNPRKAKLPKLWNPRVNKEGVQPLWKREDYAFRFDQFREVVAELDVGQPQVDSFASLGNVRCPTYWSREDDAFTKDWASCGLLWCNPPFSLLGEVVNKLEREGAECILICPEWRSLAWFSKAEELMAKGRYYPPGSRLFETDKGPAGPTRWGVWAMYIPGRGREDKVRTI